jgi:hypothetical protein
VLLGRKVPGIAADCAPVTALGLARGFANASESRAGLQQRRRSRDDPSAFEHLRGLSSAIKQSFRLFAGDLRLAPVLCEPIDQHHNGRHIEAAASALPARD